MAIEGDERAGYNAYRNMRDGRIHTFDYYPNANDYVPYMPHTDLPVDNTRNPYLKQ
jgi:hypothetical protein